MTISELTELVLNDKTNQLYILEFGEISKNGIDFIFEKTGFDLTGYCRIIDSYGIKHALKKHGNEKKEVLRGQSAITAEDFCLIPIIFSQPDNIQYVDKNRIGNDLFLYQKIIDGTIYFYVEGIRANKHGRKEAFLETMYKRKVRK